MPDMSIATTWPIVAAVVSVLALSVAFLNYRRKSSIYVRGGYTLASTVECDDRFVSSVVLENMKDRALTIYGIYLLVGFNYLIEIEDFEDSPFILRPFETIRKDYGAILFYGVNAKRLRMEPLLARPSMKKRLVLSTSEGRYVVKNYPRRWSPVLDHFRNRALAIVRPVRVSYMEHAVGGNVRYVVDVVSSNDKHEIILLQSNDHEGRRFRNFKLTPESLASAAALGTFLEGRKASGDLACKSFKVVDTAELTQKAYEFYAGQAIEAKYVGFFGYHVLCKAVTLIEDLKMWRTNRRLAKNRGATQAESDSQ